MKIITVLAHDPGTRSYGYSVVQGRIDNKKLKITILENGLIKNTIKQLKDSDLLEEQTEKYLEEVRRRFKRYKPDYFIAERYMSRLIRGTLIEVVSWMLSAVHQNIKSRYKCEFIPAVTWKNFYRRNNIDLKKLYKKVRTTPHQVDATMMAIYALTRLLKCDLTGVKVQELIRELEETSQTPLRNIKRRKSVLSTRRSRTKGKRLSS